MKGILGRKVGMTQVFLDNDKAVSVTIIDVKPNVVTNIFTKEKDDYVATQLATDSYSDKKLHSNKISKPFLGQFKKAKTAPKRFVKEIRGMEGFEIGATILADLFKPGEYVDISARSKGKGFQGAIKRHNQSIGPKSHGGGGGSQPTRLTGSIGTIAPAHVFKGMTMPGHMGHVRCTVQNLEVIFVDVKNNILVIKGGVPGPNKGYLVIKQAIKKATKATPVKLVDIEEAMKKNELLEEAKKYGADINTTMSLQEMTVAVDAAKIAVEATEKAEKDKLEAEEAQKAAAILDQKAKDAAIKAESASTDVEKEKAKEKADELAKAAKGALDKAQQEKAEAAEATKDAIMKQKAADELQVETEDDSTEENSEGDSNGK